MPLAVFDFSQLEYKVAATVWPDPPFQRAAASGDAHGGVATETFGPKENFTPERWKTLRTLAKNMNFGTLYGAEDGGQILAQIHGQGMTDVTAEDVEEFIRRFKATFPGLFVYMEQTKQQAVNPGWVVTLTGRKRHFYLRAAGFSEHSGEYRAELRAALNTVVSGPAAQLTQFTQVLCQRWLCERTDLRSVIVHNGHDALIFDCPMQEVPIVAANVTSIMTSLPTAQAPWWKPFELAVPLAVTPEIGPSWGELKPYEEWRCEHGL